MNREARDWDDTVDADHGGLEAQLEAARRRFWPMLIAFVTVFLGATAVALFWPATYRSEGTILIEQQQIPLDFVRAAVSSFAAERVEVISQRVMTSSNLGAILDKYNLFADERDNKSREQLIERMRESVTREMISADVVDPQSGGAREATIAFAVGFESSSPEIAARVANDLVTLFLQKNIESRTQMAAGTTQFLSEETERLRKRIAEIEQGVADFKARNYEQLPEFAQGNIQMLARANDEVRNVDSRIQALNQQASYLEAQLASIDPRMPAVTETGETIMNPADRLRSIREQYVGQLALYTTKHPSVASLKREIYGLEVQVGGGSSAIAVIEQLEDAYNRMSAARARVPADPEELQRLENEVGQLGARFKNLPIRSSGMSGTSGEADNPAYLSIRNQLQSAAGERASLQSRRNQLLAQISDLEQRQLRAPMVERDYAALVRELQGEQAKFAEVRQKLLDAQLSQNLESEQKGERFTLIEPPVQPREPIRPNRPAIFGIGFVLALGAAVAMLVLLETVDTRVRGRKQLELMLGAAPLAIIPWVADDAPQDRFRFWKRTAGAPANGIAS
jgi:uncharacterized protein involved in exopolysaccharide biosynthesis